MAAIEGRTAEASAAPEQSWLGALEAPLRDLWGAVADRVELLSLELQLAARALAQIIALVVIAAILAVTAWLALWGIVLFAMIEAGLHWAGASLLVLAINLIACGAALARARALAPRLRLPATRRHLGLAESAVARSTAGIDGSPQPATAGS